MTSGPSLPDELNHLGICIKTLDKSVLFQNDVCIKYCGYKKNSACIVGCMDNYQTHSQEGILEIGAETKKNAQFGNELVDSTVVNDGQKLITFFVPISDKIKNKMSFYQTKGLTKSELNIMAYKIKGLHNKEIANKLFISIATLKTHLNNIYKKVLKKE